MSNKFEKRAAWIIEWELPVLNCPPLIDLHPHILPPRWQAKRVFDYMHGMFWNSALWAAWETLQGVNQVKPRGVFMIDKGPRLIYGTSTILVASRVKDLSIIEDDSGKCVMEWTAPAGIGTDPKTLRATQIGTPFKRRLMFKGWHSKMEHLQTD